MFNRSSKEVEVQKISISIFITNFPDSFNAKDLWRVCNQYGTVVDTFIPDKRSKANKRYGFVRFIKADNVERLVSNLCTIWVGKLKLHANIARFQRKPLNQNSSQTYKIQTNKHGQKDVSIMKAANGFAGSFAHAVKKGTKSHYEEVESQPALVLDESCLNQSDMSTALMGKVKTFDSLSNLKPVLAKEGFDEITLKYMGGLWVLIDFQTITTNDKFMANTSVVSWFSHLQQALHNVFIEDRTIWVNIDGVPLKVWTKNTFNRITSKWGELIYDDDQEEMSFHNKRICVLTKLKESISESFKIIVQGKVFWVRAKEECGWTPDFVEEEENESEYDEMLHEGDHEENGNNPNSVSMILI
ncbi:nucleotide-binding alpha-beta plait domain-containing protein [Tanacetum coccineum]